LLSTLGGGYERAAGAAELVGEPDVDDTADLKAFRDGVNGSLPPPPFPLPNMLTIGNREDFAGGLPLSTSPSISSQSSFDEEGAAVPAL
jgi:hypothetical protein